MSAILDKIKESIILPMVIIEDADKAVPLAHALLESGIKVMGITLRTNAGLESIRNVSEEVPEMTVGAGTVFSELQAIDAVSAGAQFIVSPGFEPGMVKWCKERQVPVLPGGATPTDILNIRRMGLKVICFYPAEVFGGVRAINDLMHPFNDMMFIPTGGVTNDNIATYLSNPNIIAVGGKWVCPAELINEGKFQEITEICKAARAAANK